MSRNKDSDKKEALISFQKSNKRVPLWVMMKTNRDINRNPKQYNWRRSDLGKEIRKREKAEKE
jgi:large subunit ribosomal protein L39e